VNELVSNSIKYAFLPNLSGTIEVNFRRASKGLCSLMVRDNGVGLPPGLDVEASPTLGLTLVRNLVMQIEGELKIDNQSGTCFEILFGVPQ
jgi:two-component sensor histidine kinase